MGDGARQRDGLGPVEAVGRHQEVDLLWQRLRAPVRRAVALGGVAGVGKTHVARAIADRWRAGGHEVEWMAGVPGRSVLPFGAVLRLLAEGPASTDVYEDRPAQAIRAAVGRAAERPDRLVVVDDCHLLDDLSALLVQHLVLAGEVPVLLTVRSGEPVAPAVSSLWRDHHVDRVDLLPLSPAESVEVVTELLGSEVEGEAGRGLAAAGGGNPLLLSELVRDAREAGDLWPADDGWRWSGGLGAARHLREVIGDRLDSVDEADRLAVCALALAEPLPLAVLERAVPGFVAGRAEERGLVQVERGPERTEVRLGHPLFGEVVADAAGRAVDWTAVRVGLADALAASDTVTSWEDRIVEATLRLDAGQPGQAELYVAAAADLVTMGATELALRLLDAAEGDLGPSAEWRTLRAEVLLTAGRHGEATDLLEGLLDGDDDAARLAAFQMLVHACRMLDDDDRLRSAHERVRARTHDPTWRAILDATVLQVQMMAGATREAHRRAEEILRAHDEPRVRVRLASSVGTGRSLAGRTEDGLAYVAELFPEALRLREELPLAPVWAMNAQALGLLLAGRLAEAEDFVAMLRSLIGGAPRARMGGGGPWLQLFDGRVALSRGRPAVAAEALGQAADGFGADDIGGFQRWARSLEAEARALAGDRTGAGHALAAAEAARSRMAIYEGDAWRARAWARALGGELSRGIDELSELADLQRLEGQRGLEIHALHDAVRLGSTEAGARLDEALGYVDGFWPEPFRLDRAAQRSGAGADHLAAAEAFAVMGADLHAAEAPAQAARAFEAEALPGRVAAAAARRDELLAACGPARTPRLLDSPARARLTQREREVVELAASGLSNRAIAERLVVSVRTIEGHLYRAGAKLGVTDRSELARHLDRVEIA